MLAIDARDRVTLLEHTGDLGIDVTAPTPERLFEAAVLGLTDVIVDAGSVRATEERALALEAADRELLLIKLLREVLFLYDARRWLAGGVEVELAPGAAALEARLAGESFDPARHQVKTEVKAITYHALSVREEADGFHARVVFDL